MFNHMDERNKTGSKLRIGDVRGIYGCLRCGSLDIEEIGNNHKQTKDKMDYLEHCKCLNCKNDFVE